MKNYNARPGSSLTLDNLGERSTVDLYSRDGLDMLTNLWIKVAAEHRLMYETTWLGRPIIQFPTDVIAIQELLWKVRPELVIETGIAHGGSLVLSASILELIGNGKVIGIDVEIRPHNRLAIEAHPLKSRIELIEGSSTAPEVSAVVYERAAEVRSVMVILDSNHSRAHVLREMELYGPLVTAGSYLITQDGAQAWVSDIPRGQPKWNLDNPLLAIHEFLATHHEFRIDLRCNRFGTTSSPDGYLERMPDGKIQKT